MSLDELTTLAQQIERSSPGDRKEQAQILLRLRSLRDALKAGDSKDLAGCLDAAGLMTEYLTQMGGIGPDGILRVVLRLVNVVREELTAPTSAAPAASGESVPAHRPHDKNTVLRQTQAPSEEPDDLRMVSDLVLGEILVQMRAVSPDQVAQALRVQRASGKHIGETLVEIGATDWDQVRQAMHVQEHLRSVRGGGGGLSLAG